MNKKLLASLVALVVLIGGSYFLYQNLTETEEEQNTLVSETPKEEVAYNNISDEDFDFTFENEAGEKVLLSSYIGKPIVINFWASWCPPCREEMPIFQEIQKKNPEVTFLYINQTDGKKETKKKAQEFIENENLTMAIQYDETSASAIKYALTALPTTYFVDANGDIHNRAIGGINVETLTNAITGITE